jgi:hypothetical protein
MHKVIAMAGVVCIATAACMVGDSVSSSIVVNGAAWISTTLTGDTDYSGHIMASDQSRISRDIDLSNGFESRITAGSKGPALFDEFIAKTWTASSPSLPQCLFYQPAPNITRQDEFTSSGILRAGEYASYHILRDSASQAMTDVSGAGMISLKKASKTENQTLHDRLFASGSMNISDYGEFGGSRWISQ